MILRNGRILKSNTVQKETVQKEGIEAALSVVGSEYFLELFSFLWNH